MDKENVDLGLCARGLAPGERVSRGNSSFALGYRVWSGEGVSMERSEWRTNRDMELGLMGHTWRMPLTELSCS